MQKSRIRLVGFELEGMWKYRRLLPDAPLIHDLSVRNDGYNHAGEAVSPPLPIGDWQGWLRRNVPDAVNETCGFHIHVSFRRNLDYARMTDVSFSRRFARAMKIWGTAEGLPPEHVFWKRLAGKHVFVTPAGNQRNFTRKEWLPSQQLWNRNKGPDGSCRHTQINFCYAMHGTMECRLFPAFVAADTYVSAVSAYLAVVEHHLAVMSKDRERSLLIKFDERLLRQKPKVPKMEPLRGSPLVLREAGQRLNNYPTPINEE